MLMATCVRNNFSPLLSCCWSCAALRQRQRRGLVFSAVTWRVINSHAAAACYSARCYSQRHRSEVHGPLCSNLRPSVNSPFTTTTEQSTKAPRTMSASNCRGEAELLQVLQSLGLSLPTISHEEKHTVEEANKELGRFEVPCIGTKNLFLKSSKGELVLVSALHTTKTNMKTVQNAMKTKDLRFASEDLLLEKLGVVQGSVTPFALVNNGAKDVKVALDKALIDSTLPVVFHPCRNDKSTLITPTQLQDFLQKIDFPYTVVDFSEKATTAPATTDAKKTKVAPGPSVGEAKGDTKGETKLGIMASRRDNFSQWYTEVITKAEMIEYYDVSGCYIMRPWSFFIWKSVQKFFGSRIEAMGVEDCYFPMFVSKTCLEREKDHIEGFAPEVAWVTKAGESDLEVPVAIRPTSETVMYPYYAKWIRSHRDLPVRLNAWNSVVRWEFSHPMPFIRTREFLWQEGHCAWQTEEECSREVLEILDHYAAVYTDLLAVPVVKGKKTEKEKFAGGYYTTTVETYIAAVGRGCQGGTSHNLGQNFGKMFNICFQDPDKNDDSTLIPWQNSWGLSTRVIGVTIMVHGDDRGIVLPPRVACLQVVIIPVGITKDTRQEQRNVLLDGCKALEGELRTAGIRVKADLRNNYSPGWRFNHWELKGVPVRVELGPKEMETKQLSLVLRCDGQRRSVPWDGRIAETMSDLLNEIHNIMFQRASKEAEENRKKITRWDDFTAAINNKSLVLAPWCGAESCEDQVKKDSAEESKALQTQEEREDARAPSMGAKALCIPFEQPESVEGKKCICRSCDKPAQKWVLFGRSY
ncbi:bifunctional aminoacyl-tRNA synthetase, putative [Trypanosoma brucei gambiense DAL972]|uniref:proline--tRNA ligase n=1 Tax=Trypanosoma brucei gambiense (strain MHOM/CI/86/DAL972) TaxID=679716 RepID=D0A5B2_TRYB9|nr:bifunctional aminoacyl-tRNA synthetase, putative [Trypanosoma brucei gambiense DAL972]CBH16456.1 bifunctional aminoacyl-tRNA synthetase, putative [Trypanosoma brucei gambiense DAL972]|eukprot:XP_011778720.1 bifunctional aminoacyl-tRNA synthetase, putative [Trypanosoma brucei gambiense DAL972]